MSITGKVAAILNERELIINKGADHGIKEGMKFKVTEPELQIRDPDTQAPLGSLAREKIRVRIAEVQPKFSVARTFETYHDRSLAAVRFGIMNAMSGVTRVRTLRTEGATAGRFNDEGSSLVMVGDPVVEAVDQPVAT
jgi:hypothetical protein